MQAGIAVTDRLSVPLLLSACHRQSAVDGLLLQLARAVRGTNLRHCVPPRATGVPETVIVVPPALV